MSRNTRTFTGDMNRKKTKNNMVIGFERKGHYMEGRVMQLRENTVMVELHEQDSNLLDLPNNLTVVNYNNYEILSTSKNASIAI